MHPISEERTIRDLVLPALGRSDWGPSAITRELPITAGRRMVANGRIRKGERLYADLALLHQPGATATGHPISLVEVKRTVRDERTGVQQVKEYGRLLDLPLVYATNGRRIIEVDLAAGTQHEVDRFRTPEELWQNYRSIRQLNEFGIRLFEVPYSRDVLAGSSSALSVSVRSSVSRAGARGRVRLRLGASRQHELWVDPGDLEAG